MERKINKKRRINNYRLAFVITVAVLIVALSVTVLYILERGHVINIHPDMKTGSEIKDSERIHGILIDDINKLSPEGKKHLEDYFNSSYYNDEDLPGFFESFLEQYPASAETDQKDTSYTDEIRRLIEVSYQEQKLYYYENDELIFTSDIVTGNETTDIIPYGTYHVLHMTTDATLVGADYEKHVDYWIGFDNETGGHMVGFHDASWRTVFGGDEWKTNPTLECINMPTDKVQQLYEAVYVGTEIRIHD